MFSKKKNITKCSEKVLCIVFWSLCMSSVEISQIRKQWSQQISENNKKKNNIVLRDTEETESGSKASSLCKKFQAT